MVEGDKASQFVGQDGLSELGLHDGEQSILSSPGACQKGDRILALSLPFSNQPNVTPDAERKIDKAKRR